MYKLLFFYFVLIIICVAAKPDTTHKKATPKHIPQVLQYDTIKPALRGFNKQAIAQYRADKDFNYNDSNAKQNQSLWDRFWNWFWDWIQRMFGKSGPGKPSNPLIRDILLGLAVIGLIFVIFKLIGADLLNIFSKEAKENLVPYSESLENIHEITFDEEIDKALAKRNYKLAIRLLYLSCLKQLNDAGLIHWQIEKTNLVYLNELTDNDKRQSFGVLIRQFEYTWYGNFPVDERAYQNISTLFTDFKKLLI